MSMDFAAKRKNRAKGWWEFVPGTPEVNFGNANARAVLMSIGIEPDDCGLMTPAAFKAGCIKFAHAVEQGRASEFGRTGDNGTGANGCRWFELGLTATDIKRKLLSLKPVYDCAVATDSMIGWG